MRRPVLPLLTLVLALATGAALLRAEALVADVRGTPDPAAANEDLVRRYYAAANAAIGTGEVAGLEAVLAADLLLPPGLPDAEMEAGRDVLVGRLLALHAAQPNLRLVVQDVVADDDDAIARVAIEGVAPGAPLAVRLSRFGEGWLDGFRLRGGAIAGAWGATAGLGALAGVLSVEVDSPSSAESVVGLARLTLASGAAAPVLVSPGPLAVSTEAGTLRARVDGVGRLVRTVAGAPAAWSTERGVPVAVSAGGRLDVGAGVTVGLRNEGQGPAVALVAAVLPAWATKPVNFSNAGVTPRPFAEGIFEPGAPDADAEQPAGVSWQPLVMQAAALPAGRLRLDVGRAVVAPGAALGPIRPAGSVVVAVERGAVVVDGERTPSGSAPPTATLVPSGTTAALAPGVGATVRNAGDAPALLLILTIAPVGPATRTQDPGASTM